jgi:hypothetical protein
VVLSKWVKHILYQFTCQLCLCFQRKLLFTHCAYVRLWEHTASQINH